MAHEPQYDFSGQTAIITGGARGIGRAVAAHLLRSGAQVWIWDIYPVELNGAHSLSVNVASADPAFEADATAANRAEYRTAWQSYNFQCCRPQRAVM